MNDHLRLAQQLEGVLAGTVDIDALLEDASSYGEPMHHCYHGLNHWAIDISAREEKADYRMMQEAEMRKLIQLLRNGASGRELSAVHFLRPSK